MKIIHDRKITRKVTLGLSLAAAMLAGAAFAEQAVKGDGTITRAEMQTKAAARFARMDTNRDGKLDRADRTARRAAMFDRIDADRNGQISRAEFDAPRRPGAGNADDRSGMRMRVGRGGGHGHRGAMMMRGAADANHDGAITQAEFSAAAQQRFDRADANHDGRVTREERQALRGAMRAEMRQRWQNRTGASSARPSVAQPPAN